MGQIRTRMDCVPGRDDSIFVALQNMIILKQDAFVWNNTFTIKYWVAHNSPNLRTCALLRNGFRLEKYYRDDTHKSIDLGCL